MMNRLRDVVSSLDDFISAAMFAQAEYRHRNFFFLVGMPLQTVAQAVLLEKEGIYVRRDGALFCVTTQHDYIAALRHLYDTGVSGWGNYQNELIRFEICTEDEFHQALEEHMTLAPSPAGETPYATQ